ncbi:winged helix-turn-helix transcriptional regulator [Streptomyces sp. TRM66268-LWL]|uniref:Winged helix-turn-helix transcriptional regulator n=1 Tax=Streptomyces polyasparticus TaxID=2767826 RepID=A0ABR7SGB7_9ACTN|nr:winged helix-turn-helix transcriptional regulator [Streptomyces polyasparticus]MBC9714438.1 winged helix-turn-helix transcriptional regulator [Streptomyces polyasparticus]
MDRSDPGREAHRHGVDDLCEAAELGYAVALREGRVPREVLHGAPCLLELDLLRPDPMDGEWLLPASPGTVVSGLLADIEGDLAAVQQRMAALARTVDRHRSLGEGSAQLSTPLRVIEGLDRIQAAINEAASQCVTEHVGMQPGGIRTEKMLRDALPLVLDMKRRGVRVRSLYTHVARHGHGLYAYLEQVASAVEVRTIDVVAERLVIFDKSVAFVPAVADRSVALEIRVPALVEYLLGVFDRFWLLAVPLSESIAGQSAVPGITHRDHAVASLLAQGLTDAEVADRLGMNVRTCRQHIKKLTEAFGSSSRTQLGVRIAQAGLDRPPRAGGLSPP